MACYPTVPIFFGSNCSHSLLRVLHTCCRFLCLTCLRYFSFARCARPHAQVIVGCRHVSSTRAGRLLYLSYLLYFPSVRCTRTHSQSVVGCRHVPSTRAVGFLFVIIFFSSLRSHSLSVCCRLQARVFHTCCRFSICYIFSSARCARILCHRVVGCRHSLKHIFFSSLRSHSLSECCRLQARVFHTCCRFSSHTCCWFSICYIFLQLAALAPSVIEL